MYKLTWNELPSVVLTELYSNLSNNDMFAASATCSHWRDSLYERANWPRKSSPINLSAILYSQLERKLDAQPRVKRCRHRNDAQNNSICSSNIDVLERNRASFRTMMQRCARSIFHLVVQFHPYDENCLMELEQLLNTLRHGGNGCNTSKNYTSPLQTIVLRPTHIRPVARYNTRKRNKGESIEKLTENVFYSLKKLIFKCPQLVRLSFGSLENYIHGRNDMILHAINDKIEYLHLATIKERPDYYAVHSFPDMIFYKFTCLRTLSIDWDYMSAELLDQLVNLPNLSKMAVNIHGIDRMKEPINISKWNQLKNVAVFLRLMRTYDPTDQVKDLLLGLRLPLVEFSAYFVDPLRRSWLTQLIEVISVRHNRSLRRLTLMDTVKSHATSAKKQKGLNQTFTTNSENALVMLAWRCKHLSEVTIIGFEVNGVDLIAITRLRGANLTVFRVPEYCISVASPLVSPEEWTYDSLLPEAGYLDTTTPSRAESIISFISDPLNRPWRPMKFEELAHLSLYSSDKSGSLACLKDVFQFQEGE